MHYYIITGPSRGLGKALAETVLQQPDSVVIGVSRHATIEHARYHHQPLDLSDMLAVQNNLHKVFPECSHASSITLINNAAVLGEIGYVGEVPNEHFEFVMDVNVVAPSMLMNTFLRTYAHLAMPRTVLNISSGAAQRSIDGWAAYCASKAALEMLTQVAAEEQQRRGSGVQIYSLSPGVMDTEMQEQIRESDEQNFSGVSTFKAYKQENRLNTSEEVAQRILTWLQGPAAGDKSVLLRLSDI
ncbi:SDR family NAD(P)-dependent oxidoreductase [Hymenobacter sp. DG25A]|uniref:SDR family NAD(P)-dependent oxidoreductase n=1 Tax=Hymenobacter sp. DG25A TaxID=1385663 RepID=UPI0006BD6642|nr:SDR family NAD(P)-dependent oxidoreductase [Hymenobacter sp. DG25A]ALD20283.1 short-chain dehydrogenase [Hymenobacter sp. DG25A]